MPPIGPIIDRSRRAAIGALAAGAAAFAFWPSAPRSRRDIPPGRTVLSYWEKWTGPEGEAIQRVVDAFNSSQSRIYVQRLAVSDQNSKALVAIGGGDPPDLAGLFSYSVPQYAESGAAIPFDQLGLDPGPGFFTPAIERVLRHQGRLFAAPNTSYSLALYYNLDHFEEAGLSPPTSLESLADTAVALTRRAPDRSIDRVGFLPSLPWWWYYLWPVYADGLLYDDSSPDAPTAPIDSDACVRAFEWVASFPKRLGLADVRTFADRFARSYHNAGDPFLSGRCSMAFQGPWLANFARVYAPTLRFGVIPMPHAAGLPDPLQPRGLVECDVIIIPRGCPHPEEAAEFVRFTLRQDIQESLCRDHFKSSPLASLSPTFLSTHPHPGIAAFEAVARSPRVSVLPRTRVWKNYSELLLPAYDAIWAGADVRSVLSPLADRLRILIDRQQDIARRRSHGD